MGILNSWDAIKNAKAFFKPQIITNVTTQYKRSQNAKNAAK